MTTLTSELQNLLTRIESHDFDDKTLLALVRKLEGLAQSTDPNSFKEAQVLVDKCIEATQQEMATVKQAIANVARSTQATNAYANTESHERLIAHESSHPQRCNDREK